MNGQIFVCCIYDPLKSESERGYSSRGFEHSPGPQACNEHLYKYPGGPKTSKEDHIYIIYWSPEK